jgi:hypothetical protein
MRATARTVIIGVHQPHGFRHWSWEKKVSTTAVIPAPSRRGQLRAAVISASASGGHR